MTLDFTKQANKAGHSNCKSISVGMNLLADLQLGYLIFEE